VLAESSPIGQMRPHRHAPDTRVERGDRPEVAGDRPASPTRAQALHTRGSDIAVPWRATSSSRGAALEQQLGVSLETGDRACELGEHGCVLGDRVFEFLDLFAQFRHLVARLGATEFARARFANQLDIRHAAASR
jgi:hypothetical protein